MGVKVAFRQNRKGDRDQWQQKHDCWSTILPKNFSSTNSLNDEPFDNITIFYNQIRQLYIIFKKYEGSYMLRPMT
jgi:hypothetical protein